MKKKLETKHTYLQHSRPDLLLPCCSKEEATITMNKQAEIRKLSKQAEN